MERQRKPQSQSSAAQNGMQCSGSAGPPVWLGGLEPGDDAGETDGVGSERLWVPGQRVSFIFQPVRSLLRFLSKNMK